ncbi:MAG: dihydroorotate dehydrogenase electron transfer subunit [Theionarchaea archaeon]|nr:dihydroorotate dehydrogenase electron transfer subunit [Theionarchaea archaeon]MBU7038495.1 dihydroorotate dehydrogenase electron transfer subunit [Theionarchaea archaeon]
MDSDVCARRKIKILPIHDIVTENEIVRSFYFKDNLAAQVEPGQFVMVWVPHTVPPRVDFSLPDQVPMSVSRASDRLFSITVKRCGETTTELFKYEKGDYVGITGPLGKGFSVNGRHLLCVAGGIGAAALFFLVQREREKDVHFILGARTKKELFFERELRNLCTSLCITTDDGLCGTRGFASDVVADVCETHEIDQVMCCGPEIMMYKVFSVCKRLGIPSQFSLERYMYCGLGICGHCSLNGFLVCKDGPVFDAQELEKAADFGMKKVDKTGGKVPIQ